MSAEGDDDALPISALSHVVYCERSVALVHVVGVWIENEHTAAGQVVHARIDSGEETNRPGIRILRSVHVRSERLRLVGLIDVVEVLDSERAQPRLVPVETKLGPRKKRANNEVQLCAQAIALEEMTGSVIPEGAIFHAASKRRRKVAFDPRLREQTEAAARRLHEIVATRRVPRARFDDRCPQCSLRASCQPEFDVGPGALARRLHEALT